MCFRHIKIMTLVAFAASLAISKTHTVCKSCGTSDYTTIREAIEASSDGDEVVIVDLDTYEEQVDIIGLKNFTLRSQNPSSLEKPKIVWQDKENVGPRNVEEAKDSAKINYQHNGALRIMNSSIIKIEGIAISGGGNFPFGYEQVWVSADHQAYPLQHGNVALLIIESGKVSIRRCEISEAFFGIYLTDRNEGGFFANSNPADIHIWKVEPFSGAGNSGDHIIEYNRIHDNSFGLYSESAWDLGSVIRYNLFFENHHPQSKSMSIKSLTSEGNNLTGGAMVFEDHIISPLAIYNNTFWHNTTCFTGLLRSGGHYLIFNNIVAQPYNDSEFKNAWQFLDPYFPNRMFHCIYASQEQPLQSKTHKVSVNDLNTMGKGETEVTVYYPRMKGNFGEVEITDLIVPVELSDGSITHAKVENVKVPGNRIIIDNPTRGGYSASNNIRWLETQFKSIDPTDSLFLVPDWDDSLVNLYIVDQGYPAVGISDPDGSPADLGAIPKAGQYHKDLPVIKPAQSVLINGTKASASFFLTGSIFNPKITYARWINEFPNRINGGYTMGQSDVIMPVKDIIAISDLPQVTSGLNAITFTVPVRADTNEFGFLEMVIGGKSADNKSIFCVGFLPYRKGAEVQITATGHSLQKKYTPKITLKLQGKNLVTYFAGTTSTDKYTLELFDIQGRRAALFTGNSGHSRQYNLNQLGSGVYYVLLDFRGIVSKTTIRLVK